jgi:hypothetical protein
VNPWDPSEVADVQEAMAERMGGLLEPGERIAVTGESSSGEVRARFVIEGGARGERVELEARVDLVRVRLDETEARDLALDALDLLLGAALESERALRFSGVFEERELRGKPVAVRGERTFPDLEAQADALLGEEKS